MTASIALDRRSPLGRATRGSLADGRAPGSAGRRALRGFLGLLDDAVVLLLAVLLIPAAILLVGIPIALLIGVLLEMAHGLFLGLLTKAVPVIFATAAAVFLARRLSRR